MAKRRQATKQRSKGRVEPPPPTPNLIGRSLGYISRNRKWLFSGLLLVPIGLFFNWYCSRAQIPSNAMISSPGSLQVTAADHSPVQINVPPQVLGDEGRTLSEWQRVRLVAVLSHFSNQRILILASVGIETWTYASQLRDVFVEAGWTTRGPLHAPKTEAAGDVQLSLCDKYFGAGAIPPHYSSLREVLRQVGIRARAGVVFDHNVPCDVAVLWVGGRSLIEPDYTLPLDSHGIDVGSQF